MLNEKFMKKLRDKIPDKYPKGTTKPKPKITSAVASQLDEMLGSFGSPKRPGPPHDRGDKLDRTEKVTEYLRNLRVDESEDESLSEEDFMPKNTKNVSEMEKQHKKRKSMIKNPVESEDESVSMSSESSSSASESSGDDDVFSLSNTSSQTSEGKIADPFKNKKSDLKQKKLLEKEEQKSKYGDLNKHLKNTDDIMEMIRNARGARSGGKEDQPMRGFKDMAGTTANPLELKDTFDKKIMSKLRQEIPKATKKKGGQKGSTSESSALSPEEEFFKYIQGAKGKDVLDRLGKNSMDLNPDSLFDLTKHKIGKNPTSTTTLKTTSKHVNEPARTVPTRKVFGKEPAIPLKTGAISKPDYGDGSSAFNRTSTKLPYSTSKEQKTGGNPIKGTKMTVKGENKIPSTRTVTKTENTKKVIRKVPATTKKE